MTCCCRLLLPLPACAFSDFRDEIGGPRTVAASLGSSAQLEQEHEHVALSSIQHRHWELAVWSHGLMEQLGANESLCCSSPDLCRPQGPWNRGNELL